MAVEDLAPSLLALGEVVRQSNYLLNGDAAKVKLIVTTDFEHKCFEVVLQVVQSTYESLVTFLADEKVKNAKEIGEWIGLLAAPVGSLFWYLKSKAGKKVESATLLTDKDSRGMVQVKFTGDNNTILVNQNVFKLGEDPIVRRFAAKFVGPLTKEGYDSIRLGEEYGPRASTINKEDARGIVESGKGADDETTETFDPQPVIAHLQISRPDFDVEAKSWKFIYGGKPITVDISQTNIAEQILTRGYVTIGDTWRVKLLIIEKKMASGKYKNDYKVIDVLEFIPGSQQASLNFSAEPEDIEAEDEVPPVSSSE